MRMPETMQAQVYLGVGPAEEVAALLSPPVSLYQRFCSLLEKGTAHDDRVLGCFVSSKLSN
jgi:hypothetical protein